MFTVDGKFGEATIFTDNVEQEAISQVINICNMDYMKDAHVRIMPDVHSGKGCVIGFTAKIINKVCPNLIGVDIGCGVLTINLGKAPISLAQLDKICHEIPSGMNTWERKQIDFPLENLRCYRQLKDTHRILKSIGTLGGGNHFIELDQDTDGNKYLVIHSGSRNLGKQVAEYYQELAVECCSGLQEYYNQKQSIIEQLKREDRKAEIQETLKKFKEANMVSTGVFYPKDLCCFDGAPKADYLFDMNLSQQYAALNRRIIASHILKALDCELTDYFDTIHNYIDSNNVIRKGAVSAQNGERLLIPINMRDGSLICVGKGNEEWNCSAPHGAGRLMSRHAAKEQFTLEEFQESMKGIYTTSVSQSTIDESPMTYKPLEAIIENIGDTADIVNRIFPIYNFKAGGD